VIFRINQSSGVPLYIQLVEQIKHAVEIGALREGDQLPPIRKVAEELVMNPNTVIRAYRELEHEGILDLRHGSGAFIKESPAGRAKVLRKAQAVMQPMLERLVSLGLSADEIRRVFENELTQMGARRPSGAVVGPKP
jgi:GntR family transcriptional regulator